MSERHAKHEPKSDKRPHEKVSQPDSAEGEALSLSALLTPTKILQLQRLIGNRAVQRLAAEGASPSEQAENDESKSPSETAARPQINDEIRAEMQEDVSRIIEILKEFSPGESDQQAIVGLVKKYADMDAAYNSDSGYNGSDYLDKFLVTLKMRTFSRSGARTMWQDEYLVAYDALWHDLSDSALEEFKGIVAKSQKQATPGATSPEPENPWATIGKQELMGGWGILKGMGTSIAGTFDSGAAGITALMRMHGVDMADPISVSKWLETQYDESGDAMFGEDWKKADNLVLGMNAGQIGTGGGKIIWQLVMLGAKTPAALKSFLAALGIAGNIDAIYKSAENIGKLVTALRKKNPKGELDLSELLTSSEFATEVTNIAANVVALAGAGAADQAIKEALTRSGIMLNAGQAGIMVVKMSEIAMSSQPPAEKEKAAGQLVFDLISKAVDIGGGIKDYNEAQAEAAKKAEAADVNTPVSNEQKTVETPAEVAGQVEQSKTPSDAQVTHPQQEQGGATPISSEQQTGQTPAETAAHVEESKTPSQSTEQSLELDYDRKWQDNQNDDWQNHGMVDDAKIKAETNDPNRDEGVHHNETHGNIDEAKLNAPPTDEPISLGTPGTGKDGKSMRSTGMNYNMRDAAEVALGMQRDYGYSKELGGFLRSVEFNVPHPDDIGNKGTRPDKFKGDDLTKPLKVKLPSNDDYTGANAERGHAVGQELSGGDPDVARALMTMTNVWPQMGKGETGVNQGIFRAAEVNYQQIKGQFPDSQVRVRIEAVYGNPPKFVSGNNGSRIACPDAFVMTVTAMDAKGGVQHQETNTIQNQ